MAKRAGNVNAEQKQLLIEFVKTHPKLVEGKFTKDFTCKDSQRLWIDVTNILNSVPNGGLKNWRQWRKVWQDLKTKTKGKKAVINKHRNLTGGGALLGDNFDNNEKSILEMISITAVEGIENTIETAVPLLFTEKETKENEVIEEINVFDSTYNDYTNMSSQKNDSTIILPTGCTVMSLEENIKTSTILSKEYENASDSMLSMENASTSKGDGTVNKENHNTDTPRPVNTNKPSRSSKVQRLQRTLSAAENLTNLTSKKIKIKEEYYNKKLDLYKKHLDLLEKDVNIKVKLYEVVHNISNILSEKQSNANN